MNKAVFLDRDGTVNEEVGYLRSLDLLKLIPGAAAAIGRLNRAGYKVVLVTTSQVSPGATFLNPRWTRRTTCLPAC